MNQKETALKESFVKENIKYVGILILIGVILYFFQLGSMTLWDTDEALYTEIAREMQTTGDYLSTQWNYSPWFCHPPLYFWMVNLTSRVIGWNEFAARFPSAFFALLIVILVYFMGKLLINRKVGFLAGLITVTTLHIWVQARMVLLDMPFLFFLVAAVYFFFKGFLSEKYCYYAGFWISAGFAVLTKGPVGFLLPAIYVLFYLCITRQWKRALPLLYSWGIPLFLIISVPWYWAMARIYGQPFIEQTFGYFFITRIYAPVMNQDGPWYYYIPFFLAGFLPWTPFIPFMFYFLFKKFSDYRAKFLLSWVVFTFLLFTFAGTKRPNYILFIYPGLSIALGWAMYSVFHSQKFKKSSFMSFLAFSLSTLLVIGAFILASMHYYPDYYRQYSGSLFLLAAPIIVGGIIILFLTFRNKQWAFYGIVAMTVSVCLVITSYIPLVESLKPEPEIARTIKKLEKPGDGLTMRSNFGRQFSIIYYTQKKANFYHSDEELARGLREKPGQFVVMHRKNFDRIRDDFDMPLTIIKEKGEIILFYTGKDKSAPMQEDKGQDINTDTQAF
ncbi:MAG: glycosyltransferase family 39 protein [Candidatus Eremiobacteraeota bacterium]|nr:glycosyltransferase family 39 protein [Candidatus Eremiobacteraeota bacterium]